MLSKGSVQHFLFPYPRMSPTSSKRITIPAVTLLYVPVSVRCITDVAIKKYTEQTPRQSTQW